MTKPTSTIACSYSSPNISRMRSAGAHHLRDQVERHRRQRAERRRDAHRRLPEPAGDHVREGVPAEVAERLRDEKEDHGPADQPAGRVDQAVEPGGGHQPGDAEEGRRAHVVARQREAVLAGADGAAGGVELLGGPGASRGPPGDPQGDADEDEEEEGLGQMASSRLALSASTRGVVVRCRPADVDPGEDPGDDDDQRTRGGCPG